MSRGAVEIGDKLHIITRRYFEEEVRRHFVGEVIAVSEQLVEMRGYTFIFNSAINEFGKLPEQRTRVLSLADSGSIVNKIPSQVEIAAIHYQTVDNRLLVTDGGSFSLAINEFGHRN